MLSVYLMLSILTKQQQSNIDNIVLCVCMCVHEHLLILVYTPGMVSLPKLEYKLQTCLGTIWFNTNAQYHYCGV